MHKRTKGCKLIGRDGDTYYFVDSVFQYENGFAGCTGFSVRPVSSEEWEWASKREHVAERYEDYFDEIYDGSGESGRSDWSGKFVDAKTKAFEEFIDLAIITDGIGHLMFDESFTCDASDVFDRLGVEYETTDCIGCGRQFNPDSDYEELFDFNAWIGVRSFEAGYVSYEWAAKTIFGKIDD